VEGYKSDSSPPIVDVLLGGGDGFRLGGPAVAESYKVGEVTRCVLELESQEAILTLAYMDAVRWQRRPCWTESVASRKRVRAGVMEITSFDPGLDTGHHPGL